MTMPATISRITDGRRTLGNRPSRNGAAKATTDTMSRFVNEGISPPSWDDMAVAAHDRSLRRRARRPFQLSAYQAMNSATVSPSAVEAVDEDPDRDRVPAGCDGAVDPHASRFRGPQRDRPEVRHRP